MSNYIYEEYKDVVPFNIRDVGYYISTIKQGVPTNINTLAEGNGGYDPEPDPESALVPIGGILFTVDKSIWNSAKNTISGSDFNINILLASNNSTYISNLNFSSITCVFGEEYENIEYVTLLGILNKNGVGYFPTENTSIEITYLPTNTTFKREDIPTKTAGGRVIGRHVNWEGSVINFDQYGTRTNLYVPDAKYRSTAAYALITSSNQNNFNKEDSIGGPHIQSNSTVINIDNLESTTDSALQTFLTQNIPNINTEWTAKQYTNTYLQYIPDSQACLFARSVVPTELGACDIPNLYELCVLWLEGVNIDKNDPTVIENPDKKIEEFNSSASSLWASTEIVAFSPTKFYASCISGSLRLILSQTFRDSPLVVVPVLEL